MLTAMAVRNSVLLLATGAPGHAVHSSSSRSSQHGMPTPALFHPAAPVPRTQRRATRASRHHRCTATAAAVSRGRALDLSTALFHTIHPSAIAAARDAYTQANGAVHRGSCAHSLGRSAAEALHAARATVASAINAASPDEVVFVGGAAAASELLARAVALRHGDEVLLAPLECDHTQAPWRAAAKRRQFAVRRAEADVAAGCGVDFVAMAGRVSSRTRLMVMQHVCPVLGVRNPVDEVAEFARGVGVPLVVDATHSLPWGAIDVRELGCDFLFADGDAVGAPPGSGFLYGRLSELRKLPPVYGGENSLEDVELKRRRLGIAKDRKNWAPVPGRFESGMPSLAAASGLAAAMRECESAANGDLVERCADLGKQLYAELGSCPFVNVYGSADEAHVPIACFTVEGCDVGVVSGELAKRHIIVDVGCHGASIAHREELNVDSSLRVALHPSRHSRGDVSSFVQVLQDTLQRLVP